MMQCPNVLDSLCPFEQHMQTSLVVLESEAQSEKEREWLLALAPSFLKDGDGRPYHSLPIIVLVSSLVEHPDEISPSLPLFTNSTDPFSPFLPLSVFGRFGLTTNL